MNVIDPGHEYLLDSLDGEQENRLVFVKREGKKYPGNVGSHPGTTMQEVLRALVDRAMYVNNQLPCLETTGAIEYMQFAIIILERRAARCHHREKAFSKIHLDDVVKGIGKCVLCGHVGCPGSCHESFPFTQKTPASSTVENIPTEQNTSSCEGNEDDIG